MSRLRLYIMDDRRPAYEATEFRAITQLTPDERKLFDAAAVILAKWVFERVSLD